MNICKGFSTIQHTGEVRPCKRKASAGEFCWQHNGSYTHERKPNAYLVGAQRALLLEDCYVAMKKIAAGHGDPMVLAKSVLNRFSKVQS